VKLFSWEIRASEVTVFAALSTSVRAIQGLNLFAAEPQRVVTRYVWSFLSSLFDLNQTGTSISKGDVWRKGSKTQS
jgi:hypothetical protein